MKQILTLLAALVLAMVLSACADKPSDAQTKQDAVDTANAGLIDKSFFELVTAKRANGWEKEKTYVVRYDMQFKSTLGYAGMLTALARRMEAEPMSGGELGKAALLMGISMKYSDAALVKPFREWSRENQETDEYRQTVGRFLSEAPANKEHARQLMLLGAYDILTEDAHIPLGMKKGDPYAYWTEIVYIKSEKGWIRQR